MNLTVTTYDGPVTIYQPDEELRALLLALTRLLEMKARHS